jgi:hypothetical protein
MSLARVKQINGTIGTMGTIGYKHVQLVAVSAVSADVTAKVNGYIREGFRCFRLKTAYPN